MMAIEPLLQMEEIMTGSRPRVKSAGRSLNGHSNGEAVGASPPAQSKVQQSARCKRQAGSSKLCARQHGAHRSGCSCGDSMSCSDSFSAQAPTVELPVSRGKPTTLPGLHQEEEDPWLEEAWTDEWFQALKAMPNLEEHLSAEDREKPRWPSTLPFDMHQPLRKKRRLMVIKTADVICSSADADPKLQKKEVKRKPKAAVAPKPIPA